MQVATTPVVTRRNGKQQACEPCRRRKVACNHAYPACERCRRRGEAAACVYVAPVSASTSLSPSNQSRTLASAADNPDDEGQPSTLDGPASPGYLGPTSFSAVFQETQSSLALAGRLRHDSPGADGIDPAPAGKRVCLRDLPESEMRRAVGVLQRLPRDERTALSLFRRNVSPNNCWIRMADERLIITTWRAFGSYLSDRRHVARLREMVQLISGNTS